MPIGPAHVRRTALILASVLGVNLSPALASDQNWSQNGEFKLTGKFATEIVWSQSKTTWVSSAAFEKSQAGFDRSARAITFTLSGGSQLDRLLSLISSVESPRGQYNAVHYKATINPPALPTKLRIDDILSWIEQTPGQYHAIGRYQIIPDTLRRLVKLEGISAQAMFDEALQDRLALRLLEDAGLATFRSGKITSSNFMDNVARVWAGLPLANGKSAYRGIAGNRAVITRAQYQTAFHSIFK